MNQPAKKRVVIALVVVAFISSAALLARHFLAAPEAPELTEEIKADLGAVRVEAYDPANLPPQGDMTDQEYMLMLYRLREEANQSDLETGAAQKPVRP